MSFTTTNSLRNTKQNYKPKTKAATNNFMQSDVFPLYPSFLAVATAHMQKDHLALTKSGMRCIKATAKAWNSGKIRGQKKERESGYVQKCSAKEWKLEIQFV